MPAQNICHHCTEHTAHHGSTASEPGTKINVTEHHKHGRRKCDECNRPFRSQFHSTTFEHPESPVVILVRPGKHALIHKGCRAKFEARREREKGNERTDSQG